MTNELNRGNLEQTSDINGDFIDRKKLLRSLEIIKFANCQVCSSLESTKYCEHCWCNFMIDFVSNI